MFNQTHMEGLKEASHPRFQSWPWLRWPGANQNDSYNRSDTRLQGEGEDRPSSEGALSLHAATRDLDLNWPCPVERS